MTERRDEETEGVAEPAAESAQGEGEERMAAIQGTNQQKYSSVKVITTVANTMVGSAIIVFPVLFVQDGLIGSFLILLAVGVIQFTTCRLLLIHSRDDQSDFGQAIQRILGKKWNVFSRVVNSLLLFLVCGAYFMLVQSNFHQLLMAAAQLNGGDVSWLKVWWTSLVAMAFTAPLLISKANQLLLRFVKYTIYAIAALVLFVAAAAIWQLSSGLVEFGDYSLFTPDFSRVAGTFALSFLIHPVAAPILKRNKNPQRNQRDLFLGYCLTALIYIFVGLFGAFACGQDAADIIVRPDNYHTFFSCFRSDGDTIQLVFYGLSRVVQLAILVQNLSVLPILSFFTRNQILSLISERRRKIAFWVYNVAIIAFCLLLTMLEINVSLVLALDGALVGFFLIYGIPICLHLKCLHFSPSTTLLDSSLALSEDSSTKIHCNEHPTRSLIMHLAIYGFLAAAGVGLAVLTLVHLFS